MAAKYSKRILFGLLMLALTTLMPGCSGTSGTSIRNHYYSSQWSADGNIICVKNRSVTSGGGGAGFGSSIDTNIYLYVTRLSSDGSSERDLAYIGTDLLGELDLSVSPKEDYFAIGLYKELRILRSNGDVVSSAPIKNAYNVDIDWSPDESKLIVLDDDGLKVVDRASGNIFLLTTLEVSEPSWRYGDKIVFFGKINGEYCLSFINSDGTGLETTQLTAEAIGGYPQYSPDGSKIYTFWTNYIKQIDVSSKSITNTIVTSNEVFAHKISPDGTKLLGDDDDIWNYYVFTTDLDGSNRKNIVTW